MHRDPVPYLGGVGVILAVLTGLLFEGRISSGGAALVVGAALLGTMGLIDDDHHLDPTVRLLVEAAAAIFAVAVGVRIHGSGVAPLDVALTIVWIIGITNAFNLLDNMDGLAAGVASAASAAVFVLALFAGQPVIATLAAATMGACIGFLAYNRPPASIFMGDAGSLFLGFVLAVLTIDLNLNPLAAPFTFVVPLMIMAVPVLDTTLVTLARIRRGRPVWLGGKDHLSHRLVARGLRPGRAVAVLVGVEGAVGTLALLGGRRVIPLWTAALATVVVVGLLAAIAVPVKVYEEQVQRGSRRLWRAALLAGVAGTALAAPAFIALLQARSPALAAADATAAGVEAVNRADTAGAVAQFEVAERAFAQARARLSRPGVALAFGIPALSSNVRAARLLVDVGTELSAYGARLAELTDGQHVPISDGQVSIQGLRELAPTLQEAATALGRSHRRLTSIERGLLVPELSHAVRDLRTRVEGYGGGVTEAAKAAEVLPQILGADGPRRYFLAFQNSAELRGSGGLMSHWGELIADNGRLTLTRFGPLQELDDARNGARVALPEDFLRRWADLDVADGWQLVNVSPDFPTTARVITALYPQSGGQAVNGVISLDPSGLAALLELTGPVTVSGWPEPVTAANVAEIIVRDASLRFDDQQERTSFLGEVTRRVTEAFTTAHLDSPLDLTRVVGRSVRDGHLVFHLSDAREQAVVGQLEADGAVPPAQGDSLLVVNQNVAGNKLDYYLHRTISYRVTLDPSRRPASVSGQLQVVLQNTASPSGLPANVSAPFAPTAGDNRSYVSIYGPSMPTGGTLDGTPLDLRPQNDLGRQVRSATVTVPAMQTRTLSVPVEGRIELSETGWYRLDIPHQTTLSPDNVSVTVTVADGWTVAEARGARKVGRQKAEAVFEQAHDATIWVRIERAGPAALWDRFLGRR